MRFFEIIDFDISTHQFIVIFRIINIALFFLSVWTYNLHIYDLIYLKYRKLEEKLRRQQEELEDQKRIEKEIEKLNLLAKMERGEIEVDYSRIYGVSMLYYKFNIQFIACE